MENNVTPIRPERTLEDWKTYIAEASTMEIDAIIEKGRRIMEFHEDHRINGWKWNRTWDEACKDVVGVKHSTCAQYELVFSTLKEVDTVNHFLPPDVVALYNLARAIKADRKTFDDAIKTGEIYQDMPRSEAKAIMARAEALHSDDDSKIIELTGKGYDSAAIARKIGQTKGAGGKRTEHQARSWVNKQQKRLGLKPQSKAGKPREPRAPPIEQFKGMENFWDTLPKGEEREGLDPVQKVHLYAFKVKQMNDARSAVSEFIRGVVRLGSHTTPSAEKFVEHIDQMLAWRPDPTRKGTGWDFDFATDARKALATLDRYLEIAAERLAALRLSIEERKKRA
jgi:hypothetical protein